MIGEEIIKTTKGRAFVRKLAGAKIHSEVHLLDGDMPPEIRNVKRVFVKKGKKKDKVIVRSYDVVKLGKEWRPDKDPFDPNKSVSYLRQILLENDFRVIKVSRKTYKIYGHGFDSGTVSLIEFRKQAKKAIKFLHFRTL